MAYERPKESRLWWVILFRDGNFSIHYCTATDLSRVEQTFEENTVLSRHSFKHISVMKNFCFTFIKLKKAVLVERRTEIKRLRIKDQR